MKWQAGFSLQKKFLELRLVLTELKRFKSNIMMVRLEFATSSMTDNVISNRRRDFWFLFTIFKQQQEAGHGTYDYIQLNSKCVVGINSFSQLHLSI